MKRGISTLIGFLTIIFVLLSTTGCEKMPDKDWTEAKNDLWTVDGYTLKSSLISVNDTIIGYETVNAIFAVLNGSGVVVPGVNFVFGDGASVIGGEVIHAYQNEGIYVLTVYIPNGPSKSMTVNILHFGTNVTQNVIRQIYHSYSGGLCYDTLGLMVEHISGYSAPGWYFASGDFNSWPTPPNAFALTTTRVIEGKTYAIWPITHAPGLEKMNFGKNFTGGGFAWNYSPNDPYWHTTNSGGELWIYFTSTGISPTPGNNPLPGDWGDEDASNWIFRGTCFYQTTSVTTAFYINKTKVPNPSNPKFHYKLNNNSWLQLSLTDNGNYYSVQVPGISYGSLIYYYVLADSGNPTSRVALGSMMYNATQDCCIVQIQDGITLKKTTEAGLDFYRLE